MATIKRKTATKTTRPRRVPRKAKPDTAPIVLPAAEPAATWWAAVRAMQDKKAEDVKVLDLRPVTAFADFMLICSGSNPRQIQAIADEVERSLDAMGERAKSVEGYKNAEWVLMDYGDFVINIFSNTARNYYELERLWRDAPEVSLSA